METNWQENRRIAWPVIAVVCFLLLADMLPRRILLHQNLVNRLDYVYDITGLWQGYWDVFAPVGTGTRSFVAIIEYDDQSEARWHSPDPAKMSLLDKWYKYRLIEYFDNLGGEEFFSPILFRWLEQEHGRSGSRIIKITLKSYNHSVIKDNKPVLGIVKPATFISESPTLVYIPEESLLRGDDPPQTRGQ